MGAFSAAAVRYAVRNPAKATAIGALSIAGLVFADHASEVGVGAAIGDVIEGGGDVFEHIEEGAADLMDVFEFIQDVDVAQDSRHALMSSPSGFDDALDSVEHWLSDVDDVAELLCDAAQDFATDLF